MPPILKKILKILAWFTGAVLLLIIFLFIFIQTDTFNKYALEYTLNELNSSQAPKQNKINAESITGNILYGIKLNNGNVTVVNDTLLSFSYLEVNYNLWGLLDKRISLDKVILSDPVIQTSKMRSGDSLIWNFENLFSPSAPDTTSSPFDWDVSVENLKIENGFIRVSGDTSRLEPRWKGKRSVMEMFDLNKADIFDLQLDLSAKYYKDFKSITLNNLSFKTNSDLNVYKLNFNVNINEKDTTTDLWNFELASQRSDIKIYRLYAEKINPLEGFEYDSIGNKYVKVSIDVNRFDFKELRFFLPELNFLDSVVGVKIDAEGKYGDLYAENISVKLPNSYISFKGRIVNLQKPDSLYMDITGNNLVINTADVKTIYKGDIPDFTNAGIIKGDIKYKGTYTNFNTEFNISSGAGNADGNVKLDLDNEAYSGYINTGSVNLGKILRDNSLNSNLNLTAKFDGKGFEVNKMNSNITYSMNNSKFGKYDIRTSSGTLNNRYGNITLNIRHTSSMGSLVAAGKLNIANMKNPVYNMKGDVKSLNIASVTGNSDDKSNLNFNFDVNGRGISPENINGSYKLNISESHYGKYEIPSTPLDAEIHNNNSVGTVSVKTDMADINAEGTFDPGKLIDVIMYNISSVKEQIVQSTGTEGLISDSMQVLQISTPRFSGSDINFSYKIITKDSVKLSRVLQPFGINFNGNVSGEIKNSAGEFTSVNKLDIKNFIYNDTVIILQKVKTDLAINNDYTNSITGLKIDLKTTADKMSFGTNSFDSVNTSINMAGADAQIKVKAGMDTTANVLISGKIGLGSGMIKADLDTVKVLYGGYDIENKENWVINFENGDRFKFEQFNIKSRNTVLNVSGELSLNNESDIKIQGNDIKLTDIADIINKADSSYIISADKDIEGNISTFVISYKGTMDVPVLIADIKTNTLKYSGTDIGVITANMKYENNSADALVKMQNADNKGDLTIKGTIPFQNPLSGDTAAAFNISSQPVDINLKANNFMLDYFSVLVTDLASLRGVLNADLSAKGTSSDPALTGNLKITNGGYLLPLTGMDYSFDASMSTDNFKLVLNDLKFYNEDDDSKHIDLAGSLDFKDLKITDIDLEARGDMVLLDKDVEQNDLGVYGYILAGIGSPPVKITGSLDSLFVSGQLLIKDATISSIPLEGNGYNAEEDNFVYIDAGNDSLKLNRDSMTVLTPEDFAKLNPFERSLYKLAVDSSKESIVNLDLNVKTENNIYASIDFNNLTRDRLFGELKADLDIKTENGKLQAFGQVDVAGDSYYRFYRDFKLNESNIKFDGDISNPMLDIKGVYKSQKNNEQYGSVTTSDVEVVITVKGNAKEPELTLNLFQDGSEVSGSDAQSDAITYLLFGRYKSELSASERTAVASSLGASVGSLYASSYLSQTVREVLPFIVDAQFNYTEGNVQNTDVELISELGDARVKFGGKLLKDVKNFELVVDYPLNKLLNLNLPETLLLEFAREEKKQTLSTNQNDILTTEIKILYKIKF